MKEIPYYTGLFILFYIILIISGVIYGDAVAGPDWTDCPSTCKCKWSSGKKTALCSEAGLTSLPSTLNADIQVLDLSSNPIPILHKDAFRAVGLLNLQRIYLRGCSIKEVNRDAFRDLTILIEVDLSSNSLISLHPLTFTGNNRLRVLYLSGNPLNDLREEQFPSLPHLKQLEMSSCRLKHINKRAFVHLSALESLNLSNNKLKYLSESVFSVNKHIKTLVLDGNPWKCDCHLRNFRTWLLNSKLYSLPLLCSEPDDLNGHSWQDIDPMEFSCPPQIELSENMVQGDVGGNVTFGCLIRGDPEPQVHWLFNGHLLNNNGSDPDRLVDEYGEGTLEKWLNVTLNNLSDTYVGEYSCVAQNNGGTISKNLSLIIPEVITATTLSKAESWLLMAGLVAGCSGAIFSTLVGGLCICFCSRQRKRNKLKRKNKLTGSVSYTTDQEKKLLDGSLTERASGTVSFEGISQTDMELLTRDPSTIDLSEPVHITIENLPNDLSTGNNYQIVGAPYVIPPPSISSSSQPSSTNRCNTLVAPPPEFSSSLPPSTFGNIFISVSVQQDQQQQTAASILDDNRYPDLLDIPQQKRSNNGQYQFLPHHHLHHHHHPSQNQITQIYTPSQKNEIPLSCCTTTTTSTAAITNIASQIFNCEQCKQDTMLAAACATLPRGRHRIQNSNNKTGPVIRPHYDNLGPRINAAGNSTSVLSLPDAINEEEAAELNDRLTDLTNDKHVIMPEIPTPPPPPACTSIPSELVSL